jgi:hypothetical protein
MKASKTRRGWEVENDREEKTCNHRVALIWLHTHKSLNNKNKWQELQHTYQYLC